MNGPSTRAFPRARTRRSRSERSASSSARVPRHLDLEDPLPGGSEAAGAPAHAERLRLYGQADVDRLRTILRLQRDEFLPLRVIRQELAAGRAEGSRPRPKPAAPDPRSVRRSSFALRGPGSVYGLDDVLEDTGSGPRALVKELEDFGVIKGELKRARPSTTTPSARSCAP